MPLSSAREICGESARGATASATPRADPEAPRCACARAEAERNEAESKGSIASDESRTGRSTRGKCLIGFMIDFLPTRSVARWRIAESFHRLFDRERTAVAPRRSRRRPSPGDATEKIRDHLLRRAVILL